MNKKIVLRVLINSLIGAALIFTWSRFVNLSQIVQILKTVNVPILLGFFVLFLISGTLRGFRFKVLLKKYPLQLRDSIMLTFLSQFLSFMIPLRVGELSKSVYLTGEFATPLPKTVVWVFLDRFLDFWVLLFSAIILLFFVHSNVSPNLIKIMTVILILFTFGALIALKSEQIAKKIVRFLSNYLLVGNIKNKFVSFTDNIIEGFVILRRPPPEFLFLVLISAVTVVFDSLVWVLLFFALGKPISLPQGMIGNSLTAFTFLVPAAPGYVGSAEASILAIFSGILGLEPNLVSAMAVLFHIMTIVALPIYGVTSLYLLKFDLGTVWKNLHQKP